MLHKSIMHPPGGRLLGKRGDSLSFMITPNLDSASHSRESDIASTGNASRELQGFAGKDAHINTALLSEEAARGRGIAVVMLIVAGCAAVWAPLLDGAKELKVWVSIGLGQYALYSLFMIWLCKDERRYTRFIFRTYGVSAVVASTMALVYLGPYSPTALAVTLGISFFGKGQDRFGAWCICMSAILAYLLLLIGTTTGVLLDAGVFRGDEAGVDGRLFMVIMAPLVLTVTFMQSRQSRKAVKNALESAVKASRDAGRKGVQLAEAQEELDRIAAAGGVLGRLSGHVVGSYKLSKLLGRGGGGEVYDAVDVNSDEPLAVKVLSANRMDDPDLVARFQREGDIATKLISKNVVKLHQFGQAPGGVLFIAMERLEGKDLAAILRNKSRLNLSRTKDLVDDVCEAMIQAHSVGIIHRDIKPHNIFAAKTEDGESVWKVLDFGISKLTSDETSLTRGKILGTPQYMSPEQARGEEVDIRTDIYGLGAVLYRVLTGRPPVSGRGQVAVYNAATSRPVKPKTVAPKIPSDVEAVLALALAPKPGDRFASVIALKDAFEAAYHGNLSTELRERAKRVTWKTDQQLPTRSENADEAVTIKLGDFRG